jgi:hypothetical protein
MNHPTEFQRHWAAINEWYHGLGSDLDAQFPAAYARVKELRDSPLEYDILYCLMAANSTETSRDEPWGYRQGLERIIERYRGVAGHEALPVLAHCALAGIVSYRKGDFSRALRHVESAKGLLPAAPGLRRRVLSTEAFVRAFLHDLDTAQALFRRLEADDESSALSRGMAEAGQGYCSLLRHVERDGINSNLLDAGYHFWQAEREFGGGAAQPPAYRSWVEHMRLYRGICDYLAGNVRGGLRLFASLCECEPVFPWARLIAPLGALLCAREAGMDRTALDRYAALHETAAERWAARPRFYRAPFYFYLYADAVLLPDPDLSFAKKEELLRKVPEPYKKMLERTGDDATGLLDTWEVRTHLAGPVSHGMSRLLDLYMTLPAPARSAHFPHVLFAIDKSRYPFVRFHRVHAGEPASATELVGLLKDDPAAAVIALCADPRRNHVTWWSCCCGSDTADFGRTPGTVPEVFADVLRHTRMPPGNGGTLHLIVGRTELACPLHVIAERILGKTVRVFYATNQERLCRGLRSATKPPRGLHLHLPGAYGAGLRFPVDAIGDAVATVCKKNGLDLQCSQGPLDVNAAFANAYPMVIVGHGDERGAEPCIHFGDDHLLSMSDALEWPAAAMAGRSLLFISCRAGRPVPGTAGAPLNLPVIFLNHGGAMAMAPLEDIPATPATVSRAAEQFLRVLRGEPFDVSEQWRVLV